MASNTYSFNSASFMSQDMDWNVDTSQFLYDSPQPESDPFPSNAKSGGDHIYNENPISLNTSSAASQNNLPSPGMFLQQEKPPVSTLPHLTVPHADVSAPSSASASSSDSSPSMLSVRQKRGTPSTSSPPPVFGAGEAILENPVTGDFKVDGMYTDMDVTYQFEDSPFPTMGQDLNNLSLRAIGNTSLNQKLRFNGSADMRNPESSGLFSDRNDDYAPQDYESIMTSSSMNTSPQMTVHPSKTTFLLGGSRENSPRISSHDSSPATFFNSNSPEDFGNGPSSNPHSAGLGFDHTLTFPTRVSNPTSRRMPTTSRPRKRPITEWPCVLTVEDTPEKSRVETQIPIKLTLYDIPLGVTKVHLPTCTISKPKFQAKPPYIKADDTLELTTMLVCASALQKEGVEKQAFARAAMDDTPIKEESSNESSANDENDLSKPLNGGSVNICAGCIVRERKRAARKKTKKLEEEGEWAKDEAKRVIVFNCAEVRDLCVPGLKENPVKDHNGPRPDTMCMNAPMRIACYCRHQGEKIGFQVIFTIKTSTGKVLAQAISNSIMITDDHKQPTAHHGSAGVSFPSQGQIPGSGMFTPDEQYGMYSTFTQDMPFRHCWSTNDMRLPLKILDPHGLQPQRSGFQRQNGRSQQSTASATPRDLSRPASPTDPSGHSTKKRRSGGASHHKIPSALTMTSLDTGSGTNGAAGPASAGLRTGSFSFTSPSSNFNSAMDHSFYQQSMRTPTFFRSGPSTPNIANAYSSAGDDPYQYFSAPTSQHPSRAPSPKSAARLVGAGPMQNATTQAQVMEALASLPAGINMAKPPMIQRIIPHTGPRCGGDEVTVLGSGFCQGLEVMFGDKKATNTTYWGDTTLVCRAPPSTHAGHVPVVFQHQHHSAPAALQEVHGLFAGFGQVPYKYVDDERTQSRGPPMGVAHSRHQAPYEGHSPEHDRNLTANFFRAQPGYHASFQSGSSSRRMSQQG